MAKTMQQELQELRQRVRQLEGKPGDSVAELVGASESLRPSKTTFGDICHKVQTDGVAAKAERAAAAVAKNPRDYDGMHAVANLAKEFDIPIRTAGEILHPQR